MGFGLALILEILIFEGVRYISSYAKSMIKFTGWDAHWKGPYHYACLCKVKASALCSTYMDRFDRVISHCTARPKIWIINGLKPRRWPGSESRWYTYVLGHHGGSTPLADSRCRVWPRRELLWHSGKNSKAVQKKEGFAFCSETPCLDQKISKFRNCGVTYLSPSLEISVDGRLSPSRSKFKIRAKSENRRNSARDAYSVQRTKKLSDLRRLTFMRPLHATGDLDLLDWTWLPIT